MYPIILPNLILTLSDGVLLAKDFKAVTKFFENYNCTKLLICSYIQEQKLTFYRIQVTIYVQKFKKACLMR